MTTSTAVARPNQKNVRLPHSLDLSILFKDFILYWAGWRINLDEDEPFLGPLPTKEWQVSLHGSVRGVLTFRTTDRLLKTLWEDQSFKGRDFPDAETTFREMAALFTTHMVRTFWKGAFLGLNPLMARPLETGKRPSSFQCHTYSRLSLNGEPLEIRFWSDPCSHS
jgi:hypothetical protein